MAPASAGVKTTESMNTEQEPKTGTIFLHTEAYISEDFSLCKREKRLKLLKFKKGWYESDNGAGIYTTDCDFEQARWLVFNNLEDNEYTWIEKIDYPVKINPAPKNEPGDIHYTTIRPEDEQDIQLPT